MIRMQGYVEGIFKTIPLNLQNHNCQKMVQKVESFRPSQGQASIHLWCSSSRSNNRPNALPLCAGVPPREPPPPPPGRSQWGRRRWSWFWKAWKTSSLMCQPVLAASMANSCNFTKTWVFWSRNVWPVEREWGGDQGFVIGIQVSVSKSIRTESKVQDSGDHHGYSPLTIYME